MIEQIIRRSTKNHLSLKKTYLTILEIDIVSTGDTILFLNNLLKEVKLNLS